MNPKLLRIGLVLVALGVWGAVVVKAFFRARPVVAETPVPATPLAATAPPLPVSAPLDLHWPRDPFLDGGVSPSVEHTRTTVTHAAISITAPKAPPVPAAVVAPVHWPAIVYKGALNVSGPRGKRVALLAIDGRDVALRAGEEQHGIALVSVEHDSVVLRNGPEHHAIPLLAAPL